jgi:hypothetical protein
MPICKVRLGPSSKFVGCRLLVALALVAAYLIAAPSALNPAAPEEAAAATSCVSHDRTLSVRADGGRYFSLPCEDFQNLGSASASCGTVTSQLPFYPVARFDAGSCPLGPATFTWVVDGTPYVEHMRIEPNGNEPPECGPVQPGTTLTGTGSFSEAGLSFTCHDWDFDGSGVDLVWSTATQPAYGEVSLQTTVYSLNENPFLYHYVCLAVAPSDSFAINIGDDYSPNPKSLPPINVSVNFAGSLGLSCTYLLQVPRQRAAASKKCKQKQSKKARKKCKKKKKK